MRTSDVLDALTLEQLRSVAKRLDFAPSNMPKDALISWVARALPKMRGDDGHALGWYGSLVLVIGALQKEELMRVLGGTWVSEDGRNFDTTGALRRRTVDELQELLRDLVLAEDEDPSVTTADVATSARWADCFVDVTPHAERGGDFTEDTSDYEAPYEIEPTGPPPVALLRADDASFGRDEKPDLEHQIAAVATLSRWYPGPERGGVLCLPTGAGKTRTAARFLMQHALSSSTTVLWLAHRTELVDQAVRTLAQNRHLAGRPVQIGRFQSGCKIDQPVDIVVASIPTLAYGSNLQNLRALVAQQRPRRLGLVVVDECHHAVARTWRNLLKALQDKHVDAKILGLSATPTRTAEDERSALWRIFERIVYEAHPLDLIKRHVLARPKFIGVPTHQTFQASEQQRADFIRFHDLPPSLVRAIAEQQSRNELIVAYYKGNAASLGQTIIFAATIAQAEQLQRMLAQANIPSAVLSSRSPPAERSSKVAAFGDGRLRVLVNVSLFSGGTDLPKVSTVFIARPTTSRILFAQMVGRGLRGPAVGGTDECTIVSFHDIVNLATEQFASTFSEEQEALEALGLGPEAAPEPPSPSTAAPSSRRAGVLEVPPANAATEETLKARMQSLLDALLSGMRLTRTFDVTPIPLVGWWQVDAEKRRRYLPVYEPDQNVLADLIVSLIAQFARGHRAIPESLRRSTQKQAQLVRKAQVCDTMRRRERRRERELQRQRQPSVADPGDPHDPEGAR